MGQLWADVRRSFRNVPRRLGLTVVVVMTLGLGIGANTAVFSFVWGILLRPFPYPEPQDLVRVFSISQKDGGRESGNSLLDVEDWGRETSSLLAVGAYVEFDREVQGDGPARPVRICQINEGALRAVGVMPALGRLFLADEDRPGGDVHKALISHGLWQSRFGGDAQVLGRTISTAFTTYTIVGVMPSGFGFPERTDFWTPMESWYAMQVGERRNKPRNHRFYRVVARLRPGVPLARAESELNTVAATLEQRHPNENAGVRARLRPLRDAETGELRPYLAMVVAAGGFVLLICCFNVAGLLLSRALATRRDYALRAALGATRWHLLRASLAESAVLALGGGLLGIGLAYASVVVLLRLIPVALPTWMRIEIDAAALAFALAAALLSTFLSGSAAALLASRADIGDALKDNSRSSTSGGSRFRSVLVVSQVGLTLLLLIGAGLLSQTFVRLRNQATGFRSEGLLVARATNYRPGTRVEKAVALSQFHEQVLERLRALPGVVSAGGANAIPYTRTAADRNRVDLRIKGESVQEARLRLPASGADVSPGFLETMGIPLLSGRGFDGRDTPRTSMVVLVSERTAQTLWPGRDPIGQELYWGIDEPSGENPYCRVVGVVGNVRHLAGEADDGLELYYPYTQYPISSIYYVVRTHGDAGAVTTAVREAITAADQNAAIVFVKPMETIIDESLWQRRLWSVLLGAFSTLSLILVAIGLYGLLSYLVAQRSREIGVRLALGARPRSILAQVLVQGARLLALGIGFGLAAGVALKRVMANLVFGVTATDPRNLAVAAAVLAGVALLACYLPARRASAVDPIVVLRDE